ncbi:hypothetical protein B5E65_06765 [Gemmiger sp. An120]|uniref:DUF6442 family protein n=1 Tax=Gemmiger sp. An120 TaxID=1965549 RepID=UPI000B37A168|nr:DUF6442 family protein [Gemmiger sp. An120]OUQ42647.1 hypothetical protein B5E65_06765 [Gemmiger sp. An120]
MQKEEILERARQEGVLGIDEETRVMRDKGRLFGKTLFCGVFLVIALLAFAAGREIDYGVRAMFLAYLTGECYAAWRFKRSRLQLFLAAAAGFVTVLALVEVACRMLGVAL